MSSPGLCTACNVNPADSRCSEPSLCPHCCSLREAEIAERRLDELNSGNRCWCCNTDIDLVQLGPYEWCCKKHLG